MRIAIVDDIVSDQEGLKSALAAQLDRLSLWAWCVVLLCTRTADTLKPLR